MSDAVEIVVPIGSEGAFVDVVMTLPAYEVHRRQIENRPLPLPLHGRALIDTGAARTIISDDTAQALFIEPSRSVVLRTAHGDSSAEVYSIAVSLTDPSTGRAGTFELDAVRAAITGCQMLLGRDLLRFGDLRWSGRESVAELRVVPHLA